MYGHARPAGSRHGLLALLLLAIAPLLASCGSSGISPRGNVQLWYTPARILPATDDGDGAVVSVKGGGFVVCEALDDTSLTLRRYNDDLTSRWSTTFAWPKLESKWGFTTTSSGKPGFGLLPDIKEHVMSMTLADGAVSLMTYRYGEEDSIYVIGRLYDVASGSELRNEVLYATVLHEDLEDGTRRAFSSISPDSSRMIIYNFIPGTDESASAVNFAVIGARQQLLRRGEIQLKAADYLRVVQSAEIDNEGNIYVISRIKGTDIQVDLHPIEGETATMRASYDDPKNDEIAIGRIVPRLEGNRTLLLSAPVKDDGAIVGVAMVRMNMRESTPSLHTMVPITEESLEEYVGVDEFEYPYLHTIVTTNGPTPFIYLFESRYTQEKTSTSTTASGRFSSSRTTTYAVAGDILAVGATADGKLRWLSRIEKLEAQAMFGPFPASMYYTAMSFKTHVANDGTIHILHRDPDGLRLREINPSNGGFASAQGHLLLEMGGLAWTYSPFMTWLNDTEVVLFCTQGLFSRDLNLYRMNYATR